MFFFHLGGLSPPQAAYVIHRSLAFPIAGAKVWNSLPDDVLRSVSLNLPAPSEDILIPLSLQH